LKILDIAFEVGYDNHEYFTRIFKQTLGLTPSQYREKNKGILN
jgi:YesN/AraC family two-component response regulator